MSTASSAIFLVAGAAELRGEPVGLGPCELEAHVPGERAHERDLAVEPTLAGPTLPRRMRRQAADGEEQQRALSGRARGHTRATRTKGTPERSVRARSVCPPRVDELATGASTASTEASHPWQEAWPALPAGTAGSARALP